MSNVLKFERKEDFWNKKYMPMEMPELLEEMVNFNDERGKTGLTKALCVQGIVLFGFIESRCNTPELRGLASSYRRHLEHEKVNLSSAFSTFD